MSRSSRPYVSVVIPSWNRKDVLARALRSIETQTRPPDEVLVVDDGSTDGTADAVSKSFPEVILRRQTQRGVSAARNTGIRAARGDWIALLDSDDEWRPEKLDRQLDAVSQEPATSLCHTDEIWIRNGRRVNPMKKHRKHGGAIFERCLPLCAISPSSALIRKSLFDDVGLFDENLPACEDYDLWLRITARHPVLYVDEPLVVKHGGHDDQLSRRHWGMDRFRITALEKILTSGSLDADQYDAAYEMLRKKIAIVAKGARKRGKEAEALFYENKLS